MSSQEQWSEIHERRRAEFERFPREQQERLVDASEDFFVAVFGPNEEVEAMFTSIRGHARRPEHGPAGHMGVIARRRTYAREREREPGTGASAG